MRKSIHLIPLCLILLTQLGSAQQPVRDVKAKAAVLMEATTGQVLWSRSPHLQLPPASTTKIMTVLLALERAPLTRVVTVSKRASEADGSSIWLEAGEKRTMRELIYGAMLNSGNDACVAIAEAISGSEAIFAREMSAKAKDLGAQASHFVNANGLPDSGHLTCAYDLALITRAALANPTFATIVQTKVKNIPWPGKQWDRRLINHNKLLWRYPGADGVKTGYTLEAGHCLVASATRQGRRLIVVVLKSGDMYGDATKLLDYGFSQFTLVAPKAGATRALPVKGGQGKQTTSIKPASPLAYAVPAWEAKQVRLVVNCPKQLQAPIREGMELGWAALYKQKQLLARVPLIAANSVKPRNLFWAFASMLMRLIG